MPAAHYAISELAIILAAIYVVRGLWARGLVFASLAITILGGIAALGAWRFASGQIEALAAIHAALSLYGGIAAAVLIGLQSALVARNHRVAMIGIFALLTLSFIIVTFVAKFIPVILVLWLALSIFFSWQYLSLVAAAKMSLLLVAFVVIRKSPMLPVDVSWHAFHLAIALWVLVLPTSLAAAQRISFSDE
jgi:hypothetical protein